jgi:hypothetical protein
MTFEEVLAWCRANQADVRGFYRGHTVPISHADEHLPDGLPALGDIFHWDLRLQDLRHPVSASDLERLVTGRMTLEDLKGTIRGRE